MAAHVALGIETDTESLRALAKALKQEERANLLRKDVRDEIKRAVEPAVVAVQGRLAIASTSGITSRSVVSSGRSRVSAASGPSLTGYLAPRVKVQVRLSERSGGVAVRIAQTPKLRNFRLAARYLNRGKWRHPVFGHDVWVEQTSPAKGYFDETLELGKERYKGAVVDAIKIMAHRIEARYYENGGRL